MFVWHYWIIVFCLRKNFGLCRNKKTKNKKTKKQKIDAFSSMLSEIEQTRNSKTITNHKSKVTNQAKMIHSIGPIFSTTITKRPSASCKTPYVADISLDEKSELAHTPALGCCGLSDKDSEVMVSKLQNEKTKCGYRVELAVLKERGRTQWVGINPKLAETLVDQTLQKNKFEFLKDYQEAKREISYLNSRFDFAGKDKSGVPFVMEVKNVPLADYVDVAKKERGQYKGIERRRCYDEKIAYFPDGYRKNSTEVVSPRALKHIEELEEIKKTTNHRAILCFVIQRTDICHFQPSNIDLTYKEAVRKAWHSGVEIRAVQYEWNDKGECKFIRDDIPVMLYDTYGPMNTNPKLQINGK